MSVRVKLFALASQLAGRDAVDLELPDGATVADLRRALVAEVPALAPLARHVMFAIGTDYAGDTATVPTGADIACIPPVSGG